MVVDNFFQLGLLNLYLPPSSSTFLILYMVIFYNMKFWMCDNNVYTNRFIP